MSETENLKLATARTIKWNLVDRFGQQVMYAVTGIVLARLLSQADFGLVGAILIFQAFASLLVDSGFSFALLQRKQPSRLDYSTVLWFNIGLALLAYVILWFCARPIADIFQGDIRLVPLSRVMFLTFILNATSIVQINRLMKRMDVKMVAVSNIAGLTVGAVAGIWLAVAGYGAWAIVWQSVSASAVKSAVLWATGRWTPLLRFSGSALRSYFSVGSGMMLTSLLNTVFQKIYSFFIGHRAGMVSLGYYTQSEKWSAMGISSIAQVLTASFLPLMSKVQDDPRRFARIASKTNRFTCYILFPCVGVLALVAEPVFHILFGSKWDPSIILFQLLLVRGIFTVLMTNYNNYIIALGKTRTVFYLEVVRDSLAIIALVASLPWLTESWLTDVVYGIKIMLWWQVAASGISWIVNLAATARITRIPLTLYLRDMLPYVLATAATLAGILVVPAPSGAFACLILQLSLAAIIYFGINFLCGSKMQKDVWEYISYRFRKINTKNT